MGGITSLNVRSGSSVGNFDFGGFIQMSLSDGVRTTENTGFSEVSDTLRVATAGPELTYNFDNLSFSLRGNFKIDSTQDIELNELGNIFETGSGNSSVTIGMKYRF